MLHRFVLALVLASGLLWGISISLTASAQAPRRNSTAKIIVVLKPVDQANYGVKAAQELQEQFRASGLLDLKPLGISGALAGSEVYVGVVEPNVDVSGLSRQLEQSPVVLRAEPDVVRHMVSISPTLFPNDPDFYLQSYYYTIGAVAMWAKELTGISATHPITVAVIDTGIDLSHPDLFNNIVAGYDFVASNTTPQDQDGHGTMVAGVAGAETNNGIGVAGMGGGDAQAGVMGLRLMPLRVAVTDTVNCSTSAQAIVFAAMSGARVINLSYGSHDFCQTELDAIHQAYAQGAVIVAGAGNDYTSTLFYPAAYGAGTNDRLVIAVCGLAPSGAKADQSNYGTWVDVCAPFSNIRSTTISGGYDTGRGTSLSAPFVSGLIGVLMSNFGWSHDQAVSIVLASADNMDAANPQYRGLLGAGRINADRASSMVHAVFLPLTVR